MPQDEIGKITFELLKEKKKKKGPMYENQNDEPELSMTLPPRRLLSASSLSFNKSTV